MRSHEKKIMDKLYQVRFYFRFLWLLIPFRYRRRETILGVSFFLSDFLMHEIPPSVALKFIGTLHNPMTFIINGSRFYKVGVRIRVVEVRERWGRRRQVIQDQQHG